MFDVAIEPQSLDRFEELMPSGEYERFRHRVEAGARCLRGRTLWNVNSSAQGGGVAEMLDAFLPYFLGAGIETRWSVIEADHDFFALTKRIHRLLHGIDGDERMSLGPEDRRVYDETLAAEATQITTRISAGDVVIVHDPQPAGLIPALKDAGATVVWRCHIGVDQPNDIARSAWDFLRPDVGRADEFVFSRRAYAWDGLDEDLLSVIPPSIDAFSPKNQPLEASNVGAILRTAGVVDDGSSDGEARFRRADGSAGTVSREARLIEDGPTPRDALLVTQVSRWDRLKDPVGLLRGFAEHVEPDTGAHLILAGPGKSSVADDSDDETVLAEVRAAREDLPVNPRKRVHIACLPMDDDEENAAIVNALQRRADLVVQKSLAEGFGLTVAEAMWKERPLVGSRVGGIQDQIVDGETGLLVDPTDLGRFGAAVTELLRDPERAARMGRAGRERVREHYLESKQLLDHMELFERLDARSGVRCS